MNEDEKKSDDVSAVPEIGRVTGSTDKVKQEDSKKIAAQKLLADLMVLGTAEGIDAAIAFTDTNQLEKDEIKDVVKAAIKENFLMLYPWWDKLVSAFHLDEEEEQQAIVDSILHYFKCNDQDNDETLSHLFNKLSDFEGYFYPRHIEEVVFQSFIASLEQGDDLRTIKLIRQLLLQMNTHYYQKSHEKQVNEAYKKIIVKYLTERRFSELESFLAREDEDLGGYNVPKEVLHSNEVREEALGILIDSLTRKNIDEHLSLLELFGVSVTENTTPQEAMKQRLLSIIEFGSNRVSALMAFLEMYPIKKELLVVPPVSGLIEAFIIDNLSQETMTVLQAKELFTIFAISKIDVKTIVISSIGNLFTDFNGNVDAVQELHDTVSDILLLSPETKESISQVLKNYSQNQLYLARPELFIKFATIFSFSDQLFNEIDEEFSFAIINSDHIKYIPFLSNELLNSKVPRFMKNLQDEILFNLQSDIDLADYFVEKLDLNYKLPWIEKALLVAVKHFSVASKFDIFASSNGPWSTEPWVTAVVEKAQSIVITHDANKTDNENYGSSHNRSFSETDPYENDELLFTGSKVKLASALEQIMAGVAKPENFPEITFPPDTEFELEQANQILQEKYHRFVERFSKNPMISEDDQTALTDPDSLPVRMEPLLTNLISFVARYIVLSANRYFELGQEIPSSVLSNLDDALTRAFDKYIKVHEIDIPLYDKLYEEFDSYREIGRYPMEVYLGRDGIYAWIGRRAQDVARRLKLTFEGRGRLKKQGEIIEIHPNYVVFPRYFRDNLNDETKRRYLEQERISKDADPLFYDTGYQGTIPEQMMKIMGFEPEEIEERIRLLSAPSSHRRVKGISENARNDIIEYIEHNAKMEESADGLYIDKKTNRIRPTARPTTPDEQLEFMMIKQAITRHYWLKESLHHEFSDNVNIDSELYNIRINEDYQSVLPPEFILNPKQYLQAHGSLLKGSEGEGPYPDEEIYLFTLTNGTEVVAKKIELSKAKEAKKEFSILIAAKKAGLITAEAVGFLSAKNEGEGSYLLMKKVDGLSGRNFDKYLRATGKFSEQKIQEIMRVIAQKHKELAQQFRAVLGIDKRWRIKDTIIQMDEQTGEIHAVIPIDWERVITYDPNNPKVIDEIE